jgi:hypothetical protein
MINGEGAKGDGQGLDVRDIRWPSLIHSHSHSHSAGTGGWHAGEEMNPPAARVAATDHAGVGAMLVMWIWAAMAGPNVRPEERDGRVSRTS